MVAAGSSVHVVPKGATACPSEFLIGAAAILLAAQNQTQKFPVQKNLSQEFPRQVRLTEAAQFSAALKLRPIVRNARFALHVYQGGVNRGQAVGLAVLPRQVWRLGLVIPKRFEASSVRRNAIKRVWREVFRLKQSDLGEREQLGGDLVVRFLAPFTVAEKSLEQLKRQCHEDAQDLVGQLIDRLQRLRKN